MTFARTLHLLVAIFLASWPVLTYAGEPAIVVPEDQTKLLKLSGPMGELIVGNPSIVDVAVLHDDLIALTGKTGGGTNLIIRGKRGELLIDTMLHISPVEGNAVVSVRKGASSSKFICLHKCQAMVTQTWPTDGVDSNKKDKSKSDNPGPCEGPNQTASDGSRCGGRSAYDREGGRPGHP